MRKKLLPILIIKYFLSFLFVSFSFIIFSQEFHSVHQEHMLEYGNKTSPLILPSNKKTSPNNNRSNCNMNKVFYGWHPYWKNGKEVNYRWDLITHFSYFSYEVNPSNGNANDDHNFMTVAAVDSALNNGVKVTLCVTLFGSSDNSTFLTNSSAKSTLIQNLISMVSNRGAHGISIDFEGMPSSQKTNFTNFMIDLCQQMHSSIPGSEVSTVLYAVDWSSVIDVETLKDHVDYFTIMGYDYYWTGSSQAGPVAPLYTFNTSYSHTVAKSITDYLKRGVPKNKLICALPFYGRRWPVSSTTPPSNTTGNGASVIYDDFRDNSSGYFNSSNRQIFSPSMQEYYNYNNGTQYQLFIDDVYSYSKKLEHIRRTDILGTGAWALGYCDQYPELWNQVEYFMTDCYLQACEDTLFDFGGPERDYNNNEDYILTISPDPTINDYKIDFIDFNMENPFDKLYIYEGPDTNSPQVNGSPFSGSTIPSSLNVYNNSFTLRSKSDIGITESGWLLKYQCDAASGSICDIVRELRCSDLTSGSLNDGISKTYNYCGSDSMKSREIVYSIELDNPLNIGIHLYNNTSISMFLYNSCNIDSCISSSSNNNLYSYLSAGQYYLVLDAADSLDNSDYLISYSCNDEVGIEENYNTKFSVVPNPNNGDFTIQLNNSYNTIDNNQISLFDQSGKSLDFKYFTKGNTINITTFNYPKGIYYLRLIGETWISTEKIVIK